MLNFPSGKAEVPTSNKHPSFKNRTMPAMQMMSKLAPFGAGASNPKLANTVQQVPNLLRHIRLINKFIECLNFLK